MEMSEMGIAEGGITALLGYAVVFFGIVILMCVIMVFGRIMQQKKAQPAAPAAAAPDAAPAKPAAPAAKPAPAPGTGGRLLLNNVSERDAALVMAVVAYRLGKPLNELRFRSIREITDEQK